MLLLAFFSFVNLKYDSLSNVLLAKIESNFKFENTYLKTQ